MLVLLIFDFIQTKCAMPHITLYRLACKNKKLSFKAFVEATWNVLYYALRTTYYTYIRNHIIISAN